MRIVDINNHYIFKNLATDLDNCATMTEAIDVRQKALDSINKDWSDPVKEILERHAFALYHEAVNALMVMDSLEGILKHEIFNGTVKERFMVYSDETTIDKAFEAIEKELKTEKDDFTINKLEKCILERHLFELRENAKKTLKGRASKELYSSYVFSDEFKNMFNSADTKNKLDAACAKAYKKIQGHELQDWLMETDWIDLRARIASLQLSLIAAQARADEYSDISRRIIGLKELNAMLKVSGSDVRLKSVDMGGDGRVSSIRFEEIDEEGI